MFCEFRGIKLVIDFDVIRTNIDMIQKFYRLEIVMMFESK